LTANFHLKFQNSLLNLLAEGYLNPTLCKPWLDKGFRNTVNLMQFEQPGWANVHLLIPTNAPSNLSGNGSIRLGKTATRGAWIDSASANFSVSNQATTFQNLTVSIANRTGTGTLIYDFGNKQILLSSIRSNLPPDKVLLWADPNIVKTIQPYKFRSPPTILANGTVGLTSSSDTNLSLSISSNDGLDYELLGKNLHFSNITASVSIQKNTLLANIHSASLFNGSVQIQTIASLLPSNPTYQLKLNLNRVDFAPLSKLYFDYSESTGELSGHFSYSSDYSNPENLVGSGHLRIEDGNVFAIPIFGPLSPLISSVIPGAGYQNSRLATASFSVANQTIHTNDLEIVGQGFSLYGSGNIFFVKNQLDLTVRLNVKGTPGFLLFPISKFFEYYSDGSLQNPQWRPKNIPAELYGSGLLEPLTRPVKNLLLPKKVSSPSTPP
ncbi:MAG: AsmA-like C-terminal region-containing protein, partial [Chthoniobacterales bacterium]|nr:AsmA-like C-terminal region-containing protein [Chthoniobacterales bacterium]